MRGNLMGKRVNFSARSVITPDPNIYIDELGVPWSIALNLTSPETVTPHNLEVSARCPREGPPFCGRPFFLRGHVPFFLPLWGVPACCCPTANAAGLLARRLRLLGIPHSELPSPPLSRYQRLQHLVANGAHPPPGETGAKFIIRDDGQKLDLRYTKDRHLEYGWKVERHMQTGDVVLFNRQPSLHKMSIMGHRVRILPYSTFRLNISVTTPYNADFDGDEMNMHVPQSYATRAEIGELMMVPNMIVSPQANKPVIGIVQDTLLGCRKITKRDTFIEKDLFFNILMWLEEFDGRVPTPAILKPRPLWSGKQLFTMFLPKVNFTKESAVGGDKKGQNPATSPCDAHVIIKQGELLAGILCKKALGTGGGSLVHIIWEDHGPLAARSFISQTQWVVNHWLLHTGFTVGIGDTIADKDTMATISQKIADAKSEVQDIIQMGQRGDLEQMPGRTLVESFEAKVNEVLNKVITGEGRGFRSSLLPFRSFSLSAWPLRDYLTTVLPLSPPPPPPFPPPCPPPQGPRRRRQGRAVLPGRGQQREGDGDGWL